MNEVRLFLPTHSAMGGQAALMHCTTLTTHFWYGLHFTSYKNWNKASKELVYNENGDDNDDDDDALYIVAFEIKLIHNSNTNINNNSNNDNTLLLIITLLLRLNPQEPDQRHN